MFGNSKHLLTKRQKSKILKSFNNHLWNINKTIDNSHINWNDNILVDTLVLCLVHAVASTPVPKRYSCETLLFDFVFKLVDEVSIERQLVKDRLSFYHSIHSGEIPVRADFCLFDPSSILHSSPLGRCVFAFGDILSNPDCFYDYENAPLLVDDVFNSSSFYISFFKLILSEFTSLCATFSKI